MSAGPPVLAINGVTKYYKNGVRANAGVSLSVSAGEVFGLLGHNGAGKTTLLNQVLGLVKPTEGEIRIDGHDVVARPAVGRRLCSVQPQSHAPLDAVTPREAIELMARIRGAGRRRAKQQTDELVDALDIGPWASIKGQQLSGGVRRLTAFAMAIAEPGRLVMFDEPTNDVDPVRRRLLWAQVRAIADAGCAVLLVTHNVVEAEGVVDRLAILHRGQTIAQGTPAELRGDHVAAMRLHVTAADKDSARQLIAEYADGAAALVSGRRVEMAINPDKSPEIIAWLQRLHGAGSVQEFSLAPVGLEDVYIDLVGPASAAMLEISDDSLVA